MFKLVISDDEGKTTVVPLVREEITIGRKEGNTIRLTERNVSRRHARLRKANGAFALEDLGSYNGVKVNGRRIEQEASLKAGDQIAIGDYLLALQVDSAADTVADTAPASGLPQTADAATAMIAAPAEVVTPARLVMTSPPAPGAEFALSNARVRIGRAEDLDVWVNHRSISREHAQILREAGAFRIVDMGSANGVRVNGQDVQQSPIRPGDVVELGQVRFRFVGEGETYAFEADRTIQVEPVQIQAKGSKAPWILAIGLVLVAVPVAVVIALTGGEQAPDPTVTQLEPGGAATPVGPNPLGVGPTPTAPTGTENPAVAVAGAATVRQAIEACQAALGAGNWVDAVTQADVALGSESMNADAQRCRAQAAEGVALANAVASLAQPGGAAQAYAQLQAAIPGESAMRGRPEVGQIVTAYYDAQIDAARVALGAGENNRAADLADAVARAVDAPEAARRSARLIKQQALTVAVAPAHVVRTPRGPGTERNPTGPRPAGPGQVEAHPPGGGTAPPPGNDEWINCAAQGDQRCVIRALGGGRRLNAREEGTLIEAYRATSDTPRMCSSMRDFVTRFPDQTRSSQYRQVLQMRCGGL